MKIKQTKSMAGHIQKKSQLGVEILKNIVNKDQNWGDKDKLTEHNYADQSQRTTQRTLTLLEEMNQKKPDEIDQIKPRKFQIKINRTPKPLNQSN